LFLVTLLYFLLSKLFSHLSSFGRDNREASGFVRKIILCSGERKETWRRERGENETRGKGEGGEGKANMAERAGVASRA
jgi:hypothetical protein